MKIFAFFSIGVLASPAFPGSFKNFLMIFVTCPCSRCIKFRTVDVRPSRNYSKLQVFGLFELFDCLGCSMDEPRWTFFAFVHF